MRRNRLLFVGAAVMTLAVAFAVFALMGKGKTGSTNPQNVAGPVVLVPGYGGSTGSLETLASALRSQRKDVTIVDLGTAEGDLKEQARTLAAAVAQVRNRTGAPTVDIVGYSAGGLVARLFVKYDGGAKETRRVVTLGSPHHGTKLAGLGAQFNASICPEACRQMAPGSSLLNSLNTGDDTPSGPTWVSIYTQLDQVVTPPESSKLQGALNIEVQAVCARSHVEHATLPTDPVMLGIIALELADGEPPRLDSSDCTRVSS